MTTEQPYTPGPNAARHMYAMRRSTGTGGPTITAASAEFDRFIAQVRRDAAAKALYEVATDLDNYDDYLTVWNRAKQIEETS